jgi:hypothetical protein
MEPPERSATSTTHLEVLAASLVIRLAPEELELLWSTLKERAEEKRLEAPAGRLPVLAGYRDAWEPEPDVG